MDVVFAGKLICSMNELTLVRWTGRASQFKFVMPVRLWLDIIVLTMLHCHEHIIFLVGVVFADKLIIDPFTYSPEKDENR